MKRASRHPYSSKSRGNKHGTAAGAYAQAKMPKRIVSMRAVKCPDCNAEIGKPCMNGKGGEMTSVHASRRRMAVRKDNLEREQEGSLEALEWPERKRGTLECDDETVPLCDFCGLRIKADDSGRRIRHTSRGNNTRGGTAHQIGCPGSGEMIA